MGLLSGLAKLPLSPVIGVVWIARRLREQAEKELYGDAAIMQALEDLEAAEEAGELTPEQRARAESELLARLDAYRRTQGGPDVR
jgi:Gas vesicle protein G